MLDIRKPKYVEVLFDENGKTLWINTEEGCQLRISKIEDIVFSGPVLDFSDKKDIFK